MNHNPLTIAIWTRSTGAAAMRRFLPRWGWQPIPASDCIILGLSPMRRWEGFYVWLGVHGMLIRARTRRTGARVEA